MFTALMSLLLIALTIGLGLLVLKFVLAVILLPFKLLAWLVGGLVTLVVAVPLVLVFGALLVAALPVVLIVAACLLPVLLIGALAAGLLGI